MSHFTTIKTEIRDLNMLKKALNSLSYKEIKENDIVRGYMGNKQNADLVIKNTNGYDIGFVNEAGVYNIVADFWGVKLNQDEFTNKVVQRYSYEIIKDQSAIQGFSISEESVQKDGTIKIVVQKWT